MSARYLFRLDQIRSNARPSRGCLARYKRPDRVVRDGGVFRSDEVQEGGEEEEKEKKIEWEGECRWVQAGEPGVDTGEMKDKVSRELIHEEERHL